MGIRFHSFMHIGGGGGGGHTQFFFGPPRRAASPESRESPNEVGNSDDIC